MTKLAWEAIVKAGAFDCTGHNRGAVQASLDAAVAEGTRAADDRRSGQGSLFAPAGDEGSQGEDEYDGVDDSKAMTAAETLRAEYEVLGFYLSGHPLEERAGLFSLLSTTST